MVYRPAKPESVSETTGLNIKVIEHVARLYGTAKAAFIGWTMVQDGFFPTPTAEFADLVLPAAIWGEKEGTYTNSERRVGKVNAFAQPPAEAKTDFDIFLLLAEKLGVREDLYPGWSSTLDAWLEWQRVSTGRMCDYSLFTWEQLERDGGAQWSGDRRTNDGVFPTESGRAKLHCVPCLPFESSRTTSMTWC